MKKKSPTKDEALVAAVMEERRRISRELHDRALQLLSSVRLRADSCRHLLLDNPQALDKELQIIEETTEKAITEIRNLLAETQAAEELQPGSLERRLTDELAIFRARTGFKLDFQCTIRTQNLPREIEKELYFTLREGVLNAIRHSRATELHLLLAETSEGYTAQLRDNGVGFDIPATEGSNHYGLKGMRERVQRIGGKLTIQTAPGKGTEIAITIPFRGADAAREGK